jgi:hypothetical protein
MRCTLRRGTNFAPFTAMPDEQGVAERGAQQETPLEREAKKNPANRQDLEKPSRGRDSAPTDKQAERDPDSPWMGGG